MSKLLVVFGATGNQGGTTIDFVLNDPELSKKYRIRGVTRDPSKPAALALAQKGVEVVAGDLKDTESIKKAIEGAHTIFAVTFSTESRGFLETEVAQGKAVADAAVATGAQYIIWSTVPSAREISGGTLKNVEHFEAKAEVEKYIRSLPIKSAFFAPGGFFQNFHTDLAPQPAGEGAYAYFNVFHPDTPVPLLDITDTGKWIGAILSEPEKYEGKRIAASERFYTMNEIAEITSKLTGKVVTYIQLPDEVFKGYLPPVFDQELLEMFVLFRDYSYYGKDQKELVDWAAKQAKAKLTTLEEYLTQHPLQLA